MPKSKRKSKVTVRAVSRRGSVNPSVGIRDALSFYSGNSKPFRLPDRYRGPTATVTLVSDDSIPATAVTAAAIGFNPNLPNATLQNTVTGTNLGATWTATSHPQLGTLTGAAYKGRNIATRVTVRYVGNAQNCSGAMFVATGAAWNANMISAGMSAYTPQMKEYAMIPGGQWVFYMPTVGSPDFETLSGNSYFTNYLSGLVFLFSGLPAAIGTVTIRTERVVEYIPEPTGSVLVETKSEPHDIAGEEAVAVLNGASPGAEQDPGRVQQIANAVYTHILRPLGNAAVDASYAYLGGVYDAGLPTLML